LEQLDYHKYHPPLEDIAVIGRAIQRFLDSEGNRGAIGDPDELREAVDRVQAYQDFKSQRSQGMQPNQHVVFLSDGGEDVRNVQLYLNPEAEHLLDWFHVTMRLTVLNQIGEGTDEYELRPGVLKDLERLKWYLWHGNVFQALKELEGLELDLESASFESKDQTTRKVLRGVEELHTYVGQNRQFIPNYGERYRNGELISSGFVESTVNQVVSKRMVKKQQMQWTQRGAHLLLQMRTRVLNEDSGRHLS